SSVNYLIQPLVSGSAGTHAVFRAESLHLPTGSCLHRHGNMCSAPHEKRDVSRATKYVELLIVADKTESRLRLIDSSSPVTFLCLSVSSVPQYYKALNIRVALIGLEVWTSRDLINVSDNPHSTLAAFLSWRRKQLQVFPNDNAQLITGKSFQGTTIGLAPLKAMCSDYQSGGVNTDHSESAVGVAATMAHELGHNFGMSHDSAGCCQARAEDGGCIMAAATGHPFPRVFNGCNEKELKSYLSSGGGKCLFNLPNTRAMYGGQRCGNGYLEEGEECDCGEEEECDSPCCNANNCTLRAGAECAHGICCDNCKTRSAVSCPLCRAPSGPCDLPEYCDGKTELCPANFYLVDGTSCAAGQAYCYTGMCLTLEQQCLSLWGPGGRPAPDLCFKKVNEAGDMYGNCGKDLFGKYRSCKERGGDAKCGKIQCLTSASKPIENNAVRIETTVSVGGTRVQCMGTHVYKQGDKETQGDTLDPGLVMTGTKCGDDSICFNGECRNASFLQADQCNAKCHGHGVGLCNNNHNCHCDPGWAPPLCQHRGSGGSVDSGPVIGHSETHCCLFLSLMWTDGGSCVTPPSCPSPSSSTRARHPIVRPAVKPPPVPAYAAEQNKHPPEPHPHPHPHPAPSSQAFTPPPLTPAQLAQQSRMRAPPPLFRPPPLPVEVSKSHSSPSAPKHRPDPPGRPPPHCPVSRPSGVSFISVHCDFCLFLFIVPHYKH
uniref:ADAM metallopeptidase domain 19 n=1 Tax=Cynoglossus semilaevis TaxID=244447 RepID=A0A3P8WWI3_CYNSE